MDLPRLSFPNGNFCLLKRNVEAWETPTKHLFEKVWMVVGNAFIPSYTYKWGKVGFSGHIYNSEQWVLSHVALPANISESIQ